MKDGSQHESKLIVQELENSFKMLTDGDKRWEELSKCTDKSVASYNYLYDQLDHAKRFQADSEINTEFPNLKENLIGKINGKLSDEIDLLDGTRKECKKILESLQTKQEKIISLALSLEEPCAQVTPALSFLEEGVNCMVASVLRMNAALYEAKALEVAIPKASFAYHPSQRQVIERSAIKWKFYASSG